MTEVHIPENVKILESRGRSVGVLTIINWPCLFSPLNDFSGNSNNNGLIEKILMPAVHDNTHIATQRSIPNLHYVAGGIINRCVTHVRSRYIYGVD
jgi:hypothetical protein